LIIDFSGRHFGKHIILMAVRWYFAYALSYRDIEELLRERGIIVDHATINRWVIEFGPQLAASFQETESGCKWELVYG
jgi:transposase-like protein